MSAALHPWRVLAGWLLVAVALVVLGEVSGGTFVNDYRIPGAESQRAADLARDHMPGFGATSADIVLHVDSGTLRDPPRATAIRGMLDEVRRQPDVSAVGDPLAGLESADAAISPDGRTAIVTVRYSADIRDLTAQVYHRLNAAAEPVRGEGVAVEHRGIIIERAFEPEGGEAELIGLGVALLVLLIAFGSVVAAGLPILVAMPGLTAGTGLVLLAGSVVDVPTAAPLIAVMLGLGAGIDYALFVVTRFRTELAAGRPPVEAAGRAVATAGHAVVFAGGTVVVTILGLMFAGIPFIATLGLATAITIAVMVAAALTLLPALLGLLGHRVDRLRLPRGRRRAAPSLDPAATEGGGRGWARWGAHLNRRRCCRCVSAPPTTATSRRRGRSGAPTTRSRPGSGRGSTLLC
ncbi:MMPL family transporter [Virgisporangium ochraceum]|uniref:MMPL family transporter n=1 Tax=Virgisporangium ochraceum TaxID=65505 RepID=UPI00194518B0|nr:MMPL family transporter [Virgisporangium ochraceum]